MLGILSAIIAGAAMSVQGVLNTRLSEKTGLYESNVIVQGTAFLLSLIALYFLGKGNIKEITNINKFYLTGGAFGLLITISVMLAIGKLSPSVATSIILVAQLTVSALIDAFGLMGSEKIPLHWNNYTGFLLMIAGVLIFKLKIT